MTITGGQVSAATWTTVGVGVKIACHGGTLERCRVTGNQLTGANAASGVCLNSNWGRVTHCEIADNYVNTGVYRAEWHETATDVYGNPRVDRELRVDLGAVERVYYPPGTMLLLR